MGGILCIRDAIPSVPHDAAEFISETLALTREGKGGMERYGKVRRGYGKIRENRSSAVSLA